MLEPGEVLEILREKALLLLRRERELCDLRRVRGRTNVWLDVFRQMSLEIATADTDTLIRAWVEAMVERLGYQVAAVYEVDDSYHRLQLRRGVAHRKLARSITLGTAAEELHSPGAHGRYPDAGTRGLAELAAAIEIDWFFWMTFSARAKRLLLVSGFASSGMSHETQVELDTGHFAHFGAHLAALINNAALIRELDSERSELRATNRYLDHSLTELRDTQKRLVHSAHRLAEVSRRAGMADIATGVLHNVGNALNSVNVSVQVTAERLRGIRLTGLGKVVELLEARARDHGGHIEPSQTHQLAAYLRELSGHLGQERTGIESELLTLSQHIDHINWIVCKQQAYARTGSIAEACDLHQLVDDAVGLAQGSLQQLEIEIVRDFEPLDPVKVDRHKVVQILVNLLSNARHAVVEGAPERRRITLAIHRASAGRVHISVEDNGVGIRTEDLPQLFRHGFTTRQQGHGFGLHTSALAAQQLGGTLSCVSPGPGRGAKFTLDLPEQARRAT